MGFKDLFIKSEGDKKPEKKVAFKSKFPEAGGEALKHKTTALKLDEAGQFDFPKTTPTNTEFDCTPYLPKIMEMYDKGFDTLNQDGYDFFEFFTMIHDSGIDNPQAYQMAFKMAASMDKGVTKDNLLSQAEYYKSEIQKVHDNFEQQGNSQKQSLMSNKEVRKQELQSELTGIESEIHRLTSEKNRVKGELANVDASFTSPLKDIECKLIGNTQAKDTILASINKVVTGIKNNIN